jgi:hypothetical protein
MSFDTEGRPPFTGELPRRSWCCSCHLFGPSRGAITAASHRGGQPDPHVQGDARPGKAEQRNASHTDAKQSRSPRRRAPRCAAVAGQRASRSRASSDAHVSGSAGLSPINVALIANSETAAQVTLGGTQRRCFVLLRRVGGCLRDGVARWHGCPRNWAWMGFHTPIAARDLRLDGSRAGRAARRHPVQRRHRRRSLGLGIPKISR